MITSTISNKWLLHIPNGFKDKRYDIVGAPKFILHIARNWSHSISKKVVIAKGQGQEPNYYEDED
jgi:hypothetical protein